MTTFSDARANPLVLGPLDTRADIQNRTISYQVFAGPVGGAEPSDPPAIPTVALDRLDQLDRIAATESEPAPPLDELVARILGGEE